jgi:hypothetical protein
MHPQQGKRKQVYVGWSIQGRLLLRLAIFWVLYHFVLWHAMFLATGLVAAIDHGSLLEAYRDFAAQNALTLLCMIAAAPVFLWDILKFSHHVAGPLVRFQTTLRQMARGERVDRISLRPNDMTMELLDAFNEFIEVRNQELDAQRRERPSRQAEAVLNVE